MDILTRDVLNCFGKTLRRICLFFISLRQEHRSPRRLTPEKYKNISISHRQNNGFELWTTFCDSQNQGVSGNGNDLILPAYLYFTTPLDKISWLQSIMSINHIFIMSKFECFSAVSFQLISSDIRLWKSEGVFISWLGVLTHEWLFLLRFLVCKILCFSACVLEWVKPKEIFLNTFV